MRSDQAVFDACQVADGVPYALPFFPLGSAFHPENPVLGAPAVKETARRIGATRPPRWRWPGCCTWRPT